MTSMMNQCFGNRYAAAAATKEEAEQFLCSIFGDEPEISLVVIQKVLGRCGYEVEKALDALLELSSSSRKRQSSSSDITRKNYAEVLASPPKAHRSTGANLSQIVMESLFTSPKRSDEEPRTVDSCKSHAKIVQDSIKTECDVAKGAEYHVYRSEAKQHWDSVKSYHEKASAAYSNGSKAYASYLSEQAKAKAKVAREADEKASEEIFKAKNRDKGIKGDVLTIDLHGQHVKEAIKLLKMHIQYGTNTQSVRFLRVITGHGAGKSVLKPSVIKFLQKEGVKYSEENAGAFWMKLPSQRGCFMSIDMMNVGTTICAS